MFTLLLGTTLAADLRVDSAGTFLVVSIDGRLVGATPLELSDIPGGHHELGFWNSATDARPVFVEHIEMKDDDAIRVVVDMQLKAATVEDLRSAAKPEPVPAPEPEAKPEPVAEVKPPEEPREPRESSGKAGRLALNGGVTLAGVGLAGLAGYEYMLAKRSYENFLAVPSDSAARAIYEDEVVPTRNIAIGAGVGAGLALATAAGLWATTDLVVSPTPCGLVLTRSF